MGASFSSPPVAPESAPPSPADAGAYELCFGAASIAGTSGTTYYLYPGAQRGSAAGVLEMFHTVRLPAGVSDARIKRLKVTTQSTAPGGNPVLWEMRKRSPGVGGGSPAGTVTDLDATQAVGTTTISNDADEVPVSDGDEISFSGTPQGTVGTLSGPFAVLLVVWGPEE